MTLWELQTRLKGFNLMAEAGEVIIETSPEIVRLQQGQLFQGKRANGTDMNAYSKWYAEYKSSLSNPIASITDRRTLYLTGEWWKSIKVDVTSITFEIVNDDPKTGSILKREGDVLGLTKESKREYAANVFMPELRGRITRKLGLQFV